MDSLGLIRQLLAHDEWANRETLASLRAAEPTPARAMRFFAHVVACEFLWLARLQGAESPLPVWPELELDECAEKLDLLHDAWRGFLDGLDAESLAHDVAYANSKDERWTSSVGNVLTHVALHNHYHRGQIASALRAAGFEPAYTDFIHATRTGALSG